jgi:hypothetical protein
MFGFTAVFADSKAYNAPGREVMGFKMDSHYVLPTDSIS